MNARRGCIAMLLLSALTLPPARAEVKVWQEDITIPSYRLDPAETNPIFYTHESYQGAKKVIYPYPLLDGVTNPDAHRDEDQTWKALYLENEYIKLCILPEIGGRLFSAVDKTNGYEIFYHQHVIKPALIGMLGAWISGGIEWCVFHHHRNTTHMPVDYTLADNPDGSKTIWFGEIERRHRMKWLIGVTLYPQSSRIEATLKFFNRSPQPHSILYWANVAVHANDDYQVIFPPSVQYATYHAKNDFAHWPIGAESYRGVDYKGVDLSWWKNHPEPVSFFAWDLREDFSGGYDHGAKAGVVHVGNHHIVCGAKLWEWSPGPRGRMWDKILTDEDGPYAELMVGAFSDNQPDYSWIKPGETKTFKQTWYPVRETSGFKNANLDALVNLEQRGDKLFLAFNTTAPHEDARVTLTAEDKTLFSRKIDIAPDKPFSIELSMPDCKLTDLRAALKLSPHHELIAYQPVERPYDPNLPAVVKSPPAPKDIATVEELYLTGLRMEQIHSPRIDPADYYNEALRRDPDDSRTNTIVAANLNKRGLYVEAEQHLRRAIARITAEYTRPINAEAYYQLGLSLAAQGKPDEAYDAFYRATWDAAFHSPAYLQLAQISTARAAACEIEGDLRNAQAHFQTALEQINNAISTNTRYTRALCLKAAILRHLERPERALQTAQTVLAADPLDFFAANELHLAEKALGRKSESQRCLQELDDRMRRDVESTLELANDYIDAGLYAEAVNILQRPIDAKTPFAAMHPMLHYYLAYCRLKTSQPDEAARHFAVAGEQSPTYCFPYRLRSIEVFEAAIATDPNDARAPYYLGNLLYDIQPQRAVENWTRAAKLDPSFATVHRNLGWAARRTAGDIPAAVAHYERAVACDPNDPRLLVELDDLYEIANTPVATRLALLEANQATVVKRNDAYLRLITVQVLAGKYDQAIRHLGDHHFHVREGGGEIHDVFVDAHLLKGRSLLKADKPKEALEHFLKAAEYPENLSVGRPQRDPRAPEVFYHIALAYETLAIPKPVRDQAEAFYERCFDQTTSDRSAMAKYCRGLAHDKLDRPDKAAEIFDELVKSGNERLQRQEGPDIFAKFGEARSRAAQQADARFAIALGYLGKGRTDLARTELEKAVELNVSHPWAKALLDELQSTDKRQ